jgi:hypothetical protein
MDLCRKKLVNQLDVSKRRTKPAFARTDTPTQMESQVPYRVNRVQPAIFVLEGHSNHVLCTPTNQALERQAVYHAQAPPTKMGFTRRAGWTNS